MPEVKIGFIHRGLSILQDISKLLSSTFFDCVICEVFGAWAPYSVPSCVKPALAYTIPSLCVCLGFLYFSAGLEMVFADLTHLCMLAVWHPQRSFAFCVIALLISNANRQNMGIGQKSFTRQCQKYGLMQAAFLDHQFNMVLKFKCEFCWWGELKFISTSLEKSFYWKQWPKKGFAAITIQEKAFMYQ